MENRRAEQDRARTKFLKKEQWNALLSDIIHDVKSVDDILKEGADINAKDEQGRTLLMAVCCEAVYQKFRASYWSAAGYYETILNTAKILIDNGADLNTVCANGDTPLTFSIKNRKKELTKLIITSGANVCKRGTNQTPLALAVNKRDIETINLLLSSGAELTLPEALFEAVQDNDAPLEIVQLLINKGANVNLCFAGGYTPLTMSIASQNLQAVQELVKNGANVNQADSNDGYTPLTKSIETPNLQIVQELVKNGADVNQADSNGEIPLIRAVERGNSEIVKYLIDEGADPNVKEKNEHTLFIKALLRQNFEWVKRLASKENVNQRTKQGQTPLSIALSNYDLLSFAYLIKLGADPKTEMETMEEMARDDSNIVNLLHDLKLGNTIKSVGFEDATGHDGE